MLTKDASREAQVMHATLVQQFPVSNNHFKKRVPFPIILREKELVSDNPSGNDPVSDNPFGKTETVVDT